MKITKNQIISLGYVIMLIVISFVNFKFIVPLAVNILFILCTLILGFLFLNKKGIVFFTPTITGFFISASMVWYNISVMDPAGGYSPFLSALVYCLIPVLFGIFVSIISIIYSKVKLAVKN